jgi:hypothetical protein
VAETVLSTSKQGTDMPVSWRGVAGNILRTADMWPLWCDVVCSQADC